MTLPAEKRGSPERIALLVALSCVLQIAESLIPHPIPGLRLGLANMVTLIALVTLGLKPALEIAVLRTLLSSLMVGTFMSPTFLLSFSGAVASTLAMGAAYRAARRMGRYGFGIIGVSVAGALCHNMVQLTLAYLLLIRHKGILVFFPWLCFGSVGTGWITGLVAGRVCLLLMEGGPALAATPVDAPSEPRKAEAIGRTGSRGLHLVGPEMKIIGLTGLAAAVLILENLALYGLLLVFLLGLGALSRVPMGTVLARMRRFSMLVATAFLLPLIFQSGADPLFRFPLLAVTGEGLRTGTLFGLRIALLILASILVMATTTPMALASAVARLLAPFQAVGLDGRRVGEILSLSWSAFPSVRRRAIEAVDRSRLNSRKGLGGMIPGLTHLIAGLYLETDRDGRKIDSRHRDPTKGG